MSAPDDGDLLIGAPERDSAREALDEHLSEKRIDPAEHERRCDAAAAARTRAELRQIFADLPAPHPVFPTAAEPDEDPPPIFFAGCLTLALGLPVAVVLGFVYGAWWALAVPVTATVAMTYIEHLRTSGR